MSEEQKKLDEFHKCNEEARKHFKAYEFKPGEPLKVHTETDLLNYAKWRTKADIALNEYRTLLVQNHPNKLPWALEQLAKEKSELESKLEQTKNWLAEKG